MLRCERSYGLGTQPNGSQIKYEDITQIDDDDIEEMDIKWNLTFLSMRADRAPRSQDKGRKESYKKDPKVEEPTPKAMIAIDGIGWDWSYMADEDENHALVANEEEVPTEYALMAKSSSSSDNEVYDDSYCSKSCRKNTENLNNKIIKLNEELSDCETDLYNYKRGLSQVEARLVEFKENEIKFCERIRVLERDIELKDNKIENLRNELEESVKDKTGLGLNEYTVVPPPPAQVYSPPKNDLSWTGLPEFVNDTITDYSRPIPSIDVSKDMDAQTQGRHEHDQEFDAEITTVGVEVDHKCEVRRSSTNISGTKEDANQAVKDNVSSLKFIALPNWFHDAHMETFNDSVRNSEANDDPQKEQDVESEVPTVSSPVPTVSTNVLDSESPELPASPTVETVVPTVSTPIPTGSKSIPPYEPQFIQATISKDVSKLLRATVIRLFLAYSSYIGFTLYQMDVKSAFLNGTIDKRLCVLQPPVLKILEFPDKIYRVEKAMYGLHQAPRAWYGTLSKYLLANGFQRDVRTTKTPLDKENPWSKDGPGKDVDLYLYRSMIGSLIELIRRLISWQCKKQTIVATSTTEAEYVAAASCVDKFIDQISMLLWWHFGVCKIIGEGSHLPRHLDLDGCVSDSEQMTHEFSMTILLLQVCKGMIIYMLDDVEYATSKDYTSEDA
ncbi:putative ribonuclease H-like domain-containing protein [Tanacetum coccineum]